jgi:DNA-binding transcriptional MerR regulator
MPQIDPDKPLYPIGVVADMLGISKRILRIYEEKEIIKPSRSESNRRLYSLNDIEKIEYVIYLAHIKRVNLVGVKVIFRLLDKLKDKERQKLMSDFKEEIKQMNEEQKRLLQEGKEEIIENLFNP